MVEEFVIVGVFQAAFVGAGGGCAEGGEENDIVGAFLKDVLQASCG